MTPSENDQVHERIFAAIRDVGGKLDNLDEKISTLCIKVHEHFGWHEGIKEKSRRQKAIDWAKIAAIVGALITGSLAYFTK